MPAGRSSLQRRARPAQRERGRASRALLAVVAVALALAAIEFYALLEHGRPHRSVVEAPAPNPPSAPAPQPAAAAAPAAAPAIGWLDRPSAPTVVGPRLDVSGWALDRSGVAAVEVRIGSRRYAAAIGIARPDVAAAHPGYPDSAHAGFEFQGDFSAELAADRAGWQPLEIVAVARDGRETVLARKRLVLPAAMGEWRALLDANPRLAARRLRVLMMSSGIAAGGADGIADVYGPFLSRTTAIGVSVPILYLRTTRGAGGDWAFDPDFDVTRKCGARTVADDALNGVIAWAIAHALPVEFILNGGIWADAACDVPEWDVNDRLEQDPANCQWTQDDEVFPDDYLKDRPGSTASPELGRSLTYNVYASTVRHYKRRNLQAAAAIIARFARAHPSLFAGVVLDADTYMNPFVREGRWYDYNPGMLRQFRHWLAGTGPYAGEGARGVPDLSSYRRAHPLTLADVNRLAQRQWSSWEEIEPPRRFPGADGAAPAPGTLPFWEDPWFREWDRFRKHVVALHYDELAAWVHAAGIPRERIYSAQAFIAPDAGRRPVSLHIDGASPDYDSAGVSIEGAIPRDGRLGTILYGPAAENRHPMEDGRSLFATLARMDPGWGIVEYNATDLKAPAALPTYAQTYRTLRDLFNYDGSQIAMMAWNGADGLRAGQPGYVAYTAWRNTHGEEALFDFLVGHADLPRGARLWTFGTPRHADDDGWSLERGALVPGRGFVELTAEATAVLRSPPDQVLRPRALDTLVLGLADDAALARVEVWARSGPDAPWTAIGAPLAGGALPRSAAGVLVPLAWPATWRARGVIAERLKIALTFESGAAGVRLRHLALYPRGGASAR